MGPRQGGQGRRRGRRRAAARCPGRPPGGLPPGCPRGRARDAGRRAAHPCPARLRLPVGRARGGGPPLLDELAWGAHAGRARDPGRPRPALPAAGDRRPRRRPASMRLVDTPRPPPVAAVRRRPARRSSRLPSSAASSGSSSPAGTRPRAARAIELVAAYPRLVAAAGIHPHAAAETDEAGWDRTAALAGDPARGCRRGDRARLRPALLAGRGPARQPAPQPGPGPRAREAGDPPLPECGGASRRPGCPARRDAGCRVRQRRRAGRIR